MQPPTKISLNGEWQFKVDSLDKGVKERWFEQKMDRSNWMTVGIPDYWDRYNLSGYDGVGWFAKRFQAIDSLRPMTLFFGGVDDDADVWLNGTKVGSHEGYSEAFSFDVTTALRTDENELVVRVNDRGGPGGIYKPVTLVPAEQIEELLRSKFSHLNARRSAAWVRDAVIYEVYLRSFSKDGTFKALEKRVPELKTLGISVVWLMPIHPVGKLKRKGSLGSPYSVQDFYGINPEFGTLKDLLSLVKTVHDNGMKVIIDLVANHTSWDSKLIRDHPDWFTKDERRAIVPPNADWTDVADLNYDRPELRKYMIEMMSYWVRDIGIDGYRCDVAELVPIEFWESAQRELDKIKPVMMLSEGTFPEHHLKAFDLTYSWNFYDALSKVIQGTTPATIFDDLLKNESYQFPKGSLRMRFNTNHDKNAWDAPIVEKFTARGAQASAVLMFTVPGVPLVYNGEEVGNSKRLSLFEKVDIDWSKGKEFRELYTKLGALRAAHEALRLGNHIPLKNDQNQSVYSFARQQGNDRVFVAINLSGTVWAVSLEIPQRAIRQLQEYFSSTSHSIVNGKLAITLPPFGFAVFLSP